MSIYCASCRSSVKCNDAVQLLPCLHVVCLKCQQKLRKTSKICPALHCYSVLVPPMDIRWNPCEYEKCLRKLAIAGDVFHMPCQHDLCAQCFDEAVKTSANNAVVEGCSASHTRSMVRSRAHGSPSHPSLRSRNNSQCPVGGCGAPLNEDDELEPCEGSCRASYEIERMVALPCCQKTYQLVIDGLSQAETPMMAVHESSFFTAAFELASTSILELPMAQVPESLSSNNL
ncbi:hypothetical protein KIN20_025403 [Parelaphostrongylus tenuis]|uniref:RING-type domain-containing protein n=1 Tax=Parelaphostrongylus tenuis TaxID=148309 RepID=A0AAD5QWM0_PARTN|nr:hypothetical protein KIN20_025403 [Parelaphostrongylus tenuis]